jgi:hypothetical protein
MSAQTVPRLKHVDRLEARSLSNMSFLHVALLSTRLTSPHIELHTLYIPIPSFRDHLSSPSPLPLIPNQTR